LALCGFFSGYLILVLRVATSLHLLADNLRVFFKMGHSLSRSIFLVLDLSCGQISPGSRVEQALLSGGADHDRFLLKSVGRRRILVLLLSTLGRPYCRREHYVRLRTGQQDLRRLLLIRPGHCFLAHIRLSIRVLPGLSIALLATRPLIRTRRRRIS